MKKDDLIPTFKGHSLKLVLCLHGGANTGKSETLIALAHAILDSSRYYYEQKGRHTSKDRRVVFKFHGCIIGIGTYGDTEEVVDRNFEFFVNQHCDIGITAARIEGRTDIKDYIKKKCKNVGVDFASIVKKDAKNVFTREMVKVSCVDHLISALKAKGIKAIKATFERV